MPAAKEKGCGQPSEHQHIYILPHEKQAETHARIFGMESGNKFALRFGQIKGYPFAFGRDTDQKDKERQGLVDDERHRRLGSNNVSQTEGTGQHDNRDQGKCHGKFVGNELGKSPNASKERIFGIGCPASQRNPVDSDGGKGQEEQQADIQVHHLKRVLFRPNRINGGPNGITEKVRIAGMAAMAGAR